MGETRTIRVSRVTHEWLTRLAAERHETVDQTVSQAIRVLRQEALGQELAGDLTREENLWLNAEAE